MDLIKIEKQIIGQERVNAVDARELHTFLESKQDFSTWIKNRIKQYSFVEGVDFIAFHNSVEREKGGSVRKDYALSLDMSKEVSMVERNAKGKQARQYFIECEKKSRTLDLTPAEQLLRSVQLSVDNERRQKQFEIQVKTQQTITDTRIARIEAKEQDDPGYFAVTGYANLINRPVDENTAKKLGQAASKLSRQLGIGIAKVRHGRWGLVNSYHESVLEQVFSTTQLQINA